MNPNIRYILLTSLICLIIYSCSSTKYVQNYEYLLNDATVKVDAKDISYFDLEPYIKQKANYETFELFKFPLFLYNLSGKDSTKWYNRALKNAGEAPIIFDSTKIEPTISELSRIMNNKGYLDARINPQIKKKEKKIDLIYTIKSGVPTIINKYTIKINDSVFAPQIDNSELKSRKKTQQKSFEASRSGLKNYLKTRTLIQKGEQFDLDLLDRERERITSILRRNGYMAFGKESIGFVADTLDKDHNVDLTLIIYPQTQSVGNNTLIETPHKQYYVDNVDIYVDYNPILDGDINNYKATDTICKNNYRIFYGTRGNYIKANVILDNCYIQPGKLFNENRTTITYNAFSQLDILKNVNIRYEQFLQNDSTKLRAVITGVPDKKQGISAEVEGTNSSGNFGVGMGLGYTHRNAFKGSETFNAKIRGSYEAITPDFSSFKDNYFEISGETSLTFPRFIFPFLKRSVKRKMRASTQLFSNYTYQRRPNYFTRTIFSTGVKYLWEKRGNNTTKHTLDLIDLSYAHIPKLSRDFENTLSDNAKIYSFTDQFILSIGYTFSKTNNIANGLIPMPHRNKSTYSFRASVETAGNLLSLIGSLADLPKQENGSREIFGTNFAQYIRANVDYSKTIRIDDRNAIAWRLGGGFAYPYGNNKLVPFQKRFFAGGANSVRGWNARELGPGAFYRKDANFNDQSGDIRLDANIEYRSKAFWKLELAAFLDAGNIWTIRGTERQYKGKFKLDKFYQQIASAWGLGFRLDFDYVLIRLDCGWKLYDPADIPNFKQATSGLLIPNGYKSKWAVLKPFDFRKNTTWHIAVGYPF